ncbi:ral guanine nucleotide dissociation stimulator-like isoform X3 [Diceros bicornis minor]|uniref:ral guanine nucleotide dissociation stimulator-like isoform X3 n=1 Tax=Diceros bicornis minor TaxID=77932 RepID=UPI0026EC040A|nr:ral guanine nucleotide dissociation stimulator-like isoform X3 [Diceros bicornis minor]
MDAEPFQKVVPSQCLGSTWGKRNKPGSEHLAHTVQANIDHFRRVANLVITTCLGVPSMMAQDRVRVVERWIQVAQECEILKNFSSPRTVISSLQKTSICHLKNTWRKFPGGALHVCPPEGNPQRVQEKQQQQQGVVPYLGTFLGELLMLHLAMGDYLEVDKSEDQAGRTRILSLGMREPPH